MARLSDEIKAFHAAIRARALLIAIEWAGSVSRLAELAGYDRYTGTKWAQRGGISTHGAVRLTKLPSFPLTLVEMVPAIQLDRYKRRNCPKCGHYIKPPGAKTGCSPLLKASSKRAKQKTASKKRAAALKLKAKRKTTISNSTTQSDKL